MDAPGPPSPDQLLRVGAVVEQTRPVARILLGDRDPGELGILELRSSGVSAGPGGLVEVYYVLASAGDDEIAFIWKRGVAGEADPACLERLRLERERYIAIEGRTERIPKLYAEMTDSDLGTALALEYLPRLAVHEYTDGEPSAPEIGHLAAALAEFARDVPVEEKTRPYLAQVLERIQARSRTSRIWEFAVEVFAEEGQQLNQLEVVMSPGYHASNIGFRSSSPLPVFYALSTVRPRPLGSGLVTGLAFHPELDRVALIISQEIPGLSLRDIYLLALGQILESWGEGDVRGRPAACACLDALGIHISEEIRSS